MSKSIENFIYDNKSIIDIIQNSGGTVLHEKYNVIVATDITDELYDSLINNQSIDKINILSLKKIKNKIK